MPYGNPYIKPRRKLGPLHKVALSGVAFFIVAASVFVGTNAEAQSGIRDLWSMWVRVPYGVFTVGDTDTAGTVGVSDGSGNHGYLSFPASASDRTLPIPGDAPADGEVLTWHTGGVSTWDAIAGGAPADATYITQTANGTLSAEQALSALATGLVKNTTGTGVLSIAAAGTDYYNPGGTDVALADGGTGASLSDPGGDRFLGWDDTDNAVKMLNFGTNLSYDAGTDTLNATGGGSETSTALYTGSGTAQIYNSMVPTVLNPPVTLGSKTLNIAYLSPGRAIRVRFGGTIEADGSVGDPNPATLTIRLNATNIAVTAALMQPDNAKNGFYGELDIVVNGLGAGTNVTVYAFGLVQHLNKTWDFTTADTAVTIDSNLAQTVNFVGTNGAAAANDGIKLLWLSVEGLR